jgi:F-box interacting protein
MQLRCLCKFFHYLISDPKFAKKHLQLSTKRHHLLVTSKNNLGEYVHCDSPISSLFSTSIITMTQLYPPNITSRDNIAHVLRSCDGIFCGMLNAGSYFLWNPSIRKLKLLPPLDIPLVSDLFRVSFGYDCFIDNYKVIVVFSKNKVCVNSLGNDYWRKIEDFPFSYRICGPGVFVSGTVNWLARDSLDSKRVIVSLDLEKESYQNLSQPDLVNNNWTLEVLNDCLCIFARSDMFFDLWVMKEYGDKESWTKMYSVPYMEDPGSSPYPNALYISEDDQMLMEVYDRESNKLKVYDRESNKLKLVVYDPKNGTFNIPKIQVFNHVIRPKVYIESLISP